MTAEQELGFLRRLQRLLDEGEFVATYKFALLQALADLSVEYQAEPGEALKLSLDQIAEKFIEYYWRQVLPYRASGIGVDGGVLKQNTGQQAAILNALVQAQKNFGGSLPKLRQESRAWEALVHDVARTVERMPLWKLQTVANQADEFLYQRASYRNRMIELMPGIPDCFRSFHSLVTNLVQGAWVGQIRRIGANQQLLGETGDLTAFLFGSERQSLERFRAILQDHQDGRCFYCEKAVGGNGKGDVDHFIAWSRYPVDLGHNFVFAHPTCNNQKRDFLAHPDHLAHWRESNIDQAGQLTDAFRDAQLVYDSDRSRFIAAWAYEQGERSGAHAWLYEDKFQALDGSWRRALDPIG